MKKILLLLSLLFSVTIYGQDFAKGKELFKQNCAACHNMEKKMVGPALQDVVKNQGRDWTKEWIYNSNALIQSGDEHAVEVWNEYNKIAMPAYNWMDDSDLESVVTYLEKYKEDKAEKAASLKAANPTPPQGQVVVQQQPTPTIIWVLFLVVMLVVIVALFALQRGLSTIVNLNSKSSATNTYLMKKVDMEIDEVNDEFDSFIDKEVSKRVDEKVKILKKNINEKLKDFN